MGKNSYRRAWLISDTHFGVRNNSTDWLEIQKEYFYDFFIPLLKREVKEGDFLIHCGDVFDSRHSLNLLVMNEAMVIFEELAKILPVHIILGNHDIYRKNTNEVNSVRILKWVPNVTIYEEPEILNVCGKRLLMMPWRNSVEEESKCINDYPADFLFCHTNVIGLKLNRYSDVEHGISFDDIAKFRRVFSGHIHFAQNKKNFRMLGCPYQMTRSDMNNEKGVWTFDFQEEKETYHNNDVSPKFVKVLFERLLEMEIEDINKLIKNNFVDVLTDPKWSLNFPFSVFTEELLGYRRLEYVPRMKDEDDDEDVESIEGATEKVDVIDLAKRLIDSTAHPDNLKEKLFSTVKVLYERVQKSDEDAD